MQVNIHTTVKSVEFIRLNMNILQKVPCNISFQMAFYKLYKFPLKNMRYEQTATKRTAT